MSGGPRTHSAGTAEIARRSGGDSMTVDDAYALETTLSRLRQRYALYFNLPPGVRSGDERTIEVSLADNALRRNGDAEVRYRRVYMAPVSSAAEPTTITSAPVRAPREVDSDAPPVIRRRPAVNSDGPRQGPLDVGDNSTAAAAAQPAPAPKPKSSDNATADDAPSQGGWRPAKPGEK